MFGVSSSLILDKRIPRKDNSFAVKLRITYQRRPKYFPLGIHFTESDWDKINSEKPRGIYKEYKLKFESIEVKANKIIEKLYPFSFEAFSQAFNRQSDLSKDVIELFDFYITTLKKKQQFGTADSYGNARSSFTNFIKSKGRKKLYFDDITPDWLQKYEDWMLDNKKSITTVGIYTRSLRRILNVAIEEGQLRRDFYPFGKNRYQIPGGRNLKKALSLEEVQKIYNYKPSTEGEERARDFWLISYLCNGANFKDLAILQFRDLSTNSMVFIRQKTKRTTKADILPVIVGLTPEIKAIIKKWAAKGEHEADYLFGIIHENDNEQQRRVKIKHATKVINGYTKKIGEELKLHTKLTLGVARHTWATVMKNLGASDEYVGDGLGHKSLMTTKNYLGSFEDKIREQYQSQLLKF